MTHFVNIFRIADLDYGGYRVRIGRHIQGPEYSGLTDRSLRRALRARNAHYERLGAGPRLTWIEPIAPPGPSRHSSTGLTGIYRTYSVEKSGMRYETLSLRLRDLATGRPAATTLRLDHYRSDAAALRVARAIVADNAAHYNRIVALYNARRFERVMAAAHREVRTLEPELAGLQRFDRETWLLAAQRAAA